MSTAAERVRCWLDRCERDQPHRHTLWSSCRDTAVPLRLDDLRALDAIRNGEAGIPS